MGRIKEEARAKGRAEALQELAVGAGFGSADELKAALAQLSKAPAKSPPPASRAPPATESEPGEPDLGTEKERHRLEGKYQRQLERLASERSRYAHELSQAKQEAEQRQADLDALKAEMQLRTLAAQVGIKDIDYAIVLIGREIDGLAPEALEKFDERVFFESLRTKMPLLFGEAVVPASTGTGGGGAPAPPPPGRVNPPGATNSRRAEIMAMDRTKFAAELLKRGIQPGGR